MGVQATKTSKVEISISWDRVVELVRHELNTFGSKEAGMNISIPATAHVDTSLAEYLVFHWEEKS